jgi:hypothetical protein
VLSLTRQKELTVLCQEYADITDPRARAAIREYAAREYGLNEAELRAPIPPLPPAPRRPEHVAALRHIDEVNPTLRRIA